MLLPPRCPAAARRTFLTCTRFDIQMTVSYSAFGFISRPFKGLLLSRKCPAAVRRDPFTCVGPVSAPLKYSRWT